MGIFGTQIGNYRIGKTLGKVNSIVYGALLKGESPELS